MQVWKIDESSTAISLTEQLQEAARTIVAGGLVAFPTETVYGLGANAWNESAAANVFRAKGRPADNPLIVHIADLDDLDGVIAPDTQLPDTVRTAMAAFWPGPLTLILPAHPKIAPSVRPGMDTIGVRMPSHPVAQALIRAAKCPVAAPSANRSGKPSPTTASDVLEDMADLIDGVVDGGACQVGLESTVARIDAHRAVIYRPGGITREQLEQVLCVPVEFDAHLQEPDAAPLSPGMKYTHYAPQAMVHVWWGQTDEVERVMQAFVDDVGADAVAIIRSKPTSWHATTWHPARDESYDIALSRELYRLLRHFDRQQVQYILIEGVPSTGIGVALMNRLQKAAGGRVQQV